MDAPHDLNPMERRLVQKADESHTPITANFELTPLCNLHCDMCYIRMDKAEMEACGRLRTLEEWLDTARQLKEMGTLFILLTGGEPLLYPHFKELYAGLKDMGFIITINTNATLIDPQTARMFYQKKPRRVNVTLYGTSNETYQTLCHAPKGFDRCMQGLKLLKAHGIDTKLNLTILKKNKDDYAKILDIAQEMDIPAVINSYMSAHVRSTCTSQLDIPSIRLEADQVAQADMQYLKYKEGSNYHEYIHQMNLLLAQTPETALPQGQGLSCRAGKSSCWINWQGIMTPCVDMESPALAVDSAPISEIWKQLVGLCKDLPVHLECKGCRLRVICDVCYANACNEKKRCGSIDYLCNIARKKQQLMKSEEAIHSAESNVTFGRM